MKSTSNSWSVVIWRENGSKYYNKACNMKLNTIFGILGLIKEFINKKIKGFKRQS